MQLSDIVTWLAAAWSIDEAVAGLILSITIILAVLIPVMIVSHNTKNAITIWIMVFFMVQLLLVGISWLPYWTIIATILVASISFAMFGSSLTGE